MLPTALLIGLCLNQHLTAAVTFTSTPSVVSNTYAGFITLQIGGLTNGETVVVQEFLDLNTNSVIDATDFLVQQFPLTDGQASTIGGIVNSNVPADTTPTNGAISARFSFINNHFQTTAGKFLLKLSSPRGHFTPITNTLTVTNVPYPQGFTGNVVCGSTNLPNAVVLLFQGAAFESGLFAAAVADNAGHYSLKAPPGTYTLVGLKNNYLPNALTAPSLTLGATTITTNVSLVAATSSLSGKVVDAADSSLGLPAILVSAKTDSGLFPLTYSDTNGSFAMGVTSGSWQISADDISLVTHGYVGPQGRVSVTAGQSGIVLAVPKATALFYGTVKDPLGNPLVGVDVYANDNNGQYETDGYTDPNGNYWAAVLGGLTNDPWYLMASTDSSLGSYIYSQAPFEQSGGTNLNAGQAVRQDFEGIPALHQISGWLKDGSGYPISNVWISAQATIDNASFQTGADTAADGSYSFLVCNSGWTVGVNCGGGGDSLGNQYLCPDNQTLIIADNDGTANFTALLAPSQITGYVKDDSSNPIPNVSVYIYMPSGSANSDEVTTDAGGYYSFNVANGSWNVGVNCCGNDGLNPLGYLCIGEQSASVSNSASVVNFVVPHASYQITGHLWDATHNPIANVSLNAQSDSYSACASTDATGAYTLNVTNGYWSVSLDCTALNSLGYLCPQGQSVVVNNANSLIDFAAVLAPYQLTGWVKDTTNQPLPNLDVYAIALIGTNYYRSDAWTDDNGNYALPIASGQWTVGIDCGGLGGNYLCPNEVSVNIDGTNAVANFTVPPCGQVLIRTTSLPAGQVGSYYDFYLQASSCAPDFTWSIISGSLPAGLTNDPSSGEIYGTPQINGTFAFTVQVTDGNTVSTNRPLSLTISPAPPVVPSLSQPVKLAGTQFGFLLSGTPGQSYSVSVTTNPMLPLTSWSTMLTTNLSGDSAFIQDNQATDQQRFYRARIGP